MKELEELKQFCKKLSQESGKVIKKYFRTTLKIDHKADASPFTIADKKAEEVMRNMISKEYPEHGICGEEYGENNIEAEYIWVLDPIDGTKSFICGVPLFGTLIAVLKNDEPVLGVINNPILDQFLIGDNNSTELNAKKVQCRECSLLEDAVLLATSHTDIEKYQKGINFNKLVKRVKLYRTWGDCYGYYLVATGFAHIMIDPIMNKWDTMALIPIIRGAGGVITNYQGRDPVVNYKSIVAATKGLHDKVIDLLNS